MTLKLEFDADDLASRLSDEDAEALLKALEANGRLYSQREFEDGCARAAADALADAEQERVEELENVLVRLRRRDYPETLHTLAIALGREFYPLEEIPLAARQ